MVLQDLFARTYIINLQDRPDRRQEIEQELRFIGSGLIPGKVEFFSAIRPEKYGAFPNREVLGCFLSHLQILKKAQAENLQNVLIIEDDLAISKRIKGSLHYLPKLIKEMDWDILFLGFLPRYGLYFKDYYNEENDSSGGVYNFRSFTIKTTKTPTRGTHFYAVNQKIYASLISYLETLLEQRFSQASSISIRGFDNLDGAYIDTAYFLFNQHQSSARILLVCPPLGWQRSSRSDVNPSRLDKFKFLEFLLRIYRPLKGFIKRNMEAVYPLFFSR